MASNNLVSSSNYGSSYRLNLSIIDVILSSQLSRYFRTMLEVKCTMIHFQTRFSSKTKISITFSIEDYNLK